MRNLLTARQAATYFGIHPNTLRQWAAKGVIKTIDIGNNRKRYDVSSVEKQPEQDHGQTDL